MVGERTSAAPWINYPGPRIWAVHLFVRPPSLRQVQLLDFSRFVLSLAMVLAIYLLTWPRHAGGQIEPPLSLRAAARWSCAILIGGMFMLGINYVPITASPSPILGTMAILFAELPCTLLVYLYLSVLAGWLDLPRESEWLRRCGWSVAMILCGSVVMITLGYPPQAAHRTSHFSGASARSQAPSPS